MKLCLEAAIKNGANLAGADLSEANLSGADLSRANLSRANLSGAINAEAAIARTVITPQGELDVWKKCRNGIIVSLRIPRDARRSSAHGRKCRAEKALVLEVFSSTGIAHSTTDAPNSVVYKSGETVVCDKWCEDRWHECAGGIHFYLTREEAEAH